MACSRPCGCAAAGFGCWSIISDRLVRRRARAADRGAGAARLCGANCTRAAQDCKRGRAETDRHPRRVVDARLSADGQRNDAHAHCSRCMPCRAALLRGSITPVRVRLCATPLGLNPRLAGLKSLNRLESVLARSEWRDARIWEGLMQDMDRNIVCGTMSNLFLRRESRLLTPLLDRCGVAGVMRRWVMRNGRQVAASRHRAPHTLAGSAQAEEVFMSNAVGGKSVGVRSNGAGAAAFLRLRHGDGAADTVGRCERMAIALVVGCCCSPRAGGGIWLGGFAASTNR